MHPLDKLMEDVRLFHRTFGHPYGQRPQAQRPDIAAKRSEWIESECKELRDAGPILVEQVDAYLDIIYFAVGGLVELGVEAGVLWDFVQEANMAKIWSDGRAHLTPEGRVMKPSGWTAPDEDIRQEINRQRSLP